MFVLRLLLLLHSLPTKADIHANSTQALGIALSSHRLDIIPPIISLARDPTLLSWLLRLVVREGVIDGQSRSYKNEVLTLLLKLFEEVDEPDYFSIVQCWVYLPSPRSASDLLGRLVKSGREEDHLKAYQISFDLVEMATQEFLEVVRREVRTWGEGEEWKRVDEILGGEESIKLFLEFLYRNNQADLLILNRSKVCLFFFFSLSSLSLTPSSLQPHPNSFFPLTLRPHTGSPRTPKQYLPLSPNLPKRLLQRRHHIGPLPPHEPRLACPSLKLVQILCYSWFRRNSQRQPQSRSSNSRTLFTERRRSGECLL